MPLHILVVDDNQPNLRVMTALLEHCGFSCATARDGTEALALLAQESFNLALMDVDMPNMDGLEATRLLRMREARLGLKPIPVIGVTAHARLSDRKRCLDAGMDGYLTKPVNVKEMCDTIEKTARRETGEPV